MAIIILALLAPARLAASQQYAGRWVRTSLRLNVKIESWGDHCGPEPKSYGSKKNVGIEIVAQGQHLVFSKGNLRTDRCMSYNPRLHSISQSVSSGSWERVCQTSQNDPKFERAEYSLSAQGANRLVYRAKSHYDWKLKGDHCVANVTETRVFVRESAAEEPSERSEAPPKKTVSPECEDHGQASALVVTPRNVRIGPGERICFTARGRDKNGCRFPVQATWTAYQGGREVGGLLSRRGCFSAGKNAAEAEGEYEVVARLEKLAARAEVTVAFPELGDLLAARLDPVEEETDDPPTGDVASETGTADAGLQPANVAPAEAGGGWRTIAVVVIAALVSIAALALVLLLVRKGSMRRSALDEEDDWLDAEPPIEAPERRESGAVRCPRCGNEFPAGAKFCPHDGAELEPIPSSSRSPGEDPDRGGMICPRCHRPYEAGAKFCPHDKEKLIPYAIWRERQQRGER
ncbi:MAG: zinc ribbon domain-containing protein [Polyangia bacterium]